jgi:anaerobic selenocysteine-containing dehydrogenase
MTWPRSTRWMPRNWGSRPATPSADLYHRIITCKARLWEGVRPGTVAKCYGQGHWAYGRVAAKEYGKTPLGGNNNELMPSDFDRLSGATARNGGFTGVKIEKA